MLLCQSLPLLPTESLLAISLPDSSFLATKLVLTSGKTIVARYPFSKCIKPAHTILQSSCLLVIIHSRYTRARCKKAT